MVRWVKIKDRRPTDTDADVDGVVVVRFKRSYETCYAYDYLLVGDLQQQIFNDYQWLEGGQEDCESLPPVVAVEDVRMILMEDE